MPETIIPNRLAQTKIIFTTKIKPDIQITYSLKLFLNFFIIECDNFTETQRNIRAQHPTRRQSLRRRVGSELTFTFHPKTQNRRVCSICSVSIDFSLFSKKQQLWQLQQL